MIFIILCMTLIPFFLNCYSESDYTNTNSQSMTFEHIPALDVVGTADIDTLKVYCDVTTKPNYILCKSDSTEDTVRQIPLSELTNIILAKNAVITDTRNASAFPIDNVVMVILIIFFLLQQFQINHLNDRIKKL